MDYRYINKLCIFLKRRAFRIKFGSQNFKKEIWSFHVIKHRKTLHFDQKSNLAETMSFVEKNHIFLYKC